jgi:hypothetical protein
VGVDENEGRDVRVGDGVRYAIRGGKPNIATTIVTIAPISATVIDVSGFSLMDLSCFLSLLLLISPPDVAERPTTISNIVLIRELSVKPLFDD